MQDITQALEEVRGLYQKVVGQPAPALSPQFLVPFPAGVDPLQHAVNEVQYLKQLDERVAFAPQPGAWVPVADSFITKEEFLVHMELPGVSKEDLKVFVIGGECVVRGERKPPSCTGDMRPMSIERPWGTFERRFTIPVGAMVDELKARHREGILELKIPMEAIEVPKEKKVEVA